MIHDRILKDQVINWPFSGKPNVTIVPEPAGPRNIYVDPFPCYNHDVSILMNVARKVEELFPINPLPYYVVLAYDTEDRTNGYVDESYKYDNKTDKCTYYPFIVLAGKRVPIHPAITRYLVAHEYGHLVKRYIDRKRNPKDNSIVTDFDREYAKLRKIECYTNYGAGHWHKNIGEIIANDFRICVAKEELEFYPHDIYYPLDCPDVVEFWEKLRNENCV